MGEFHGTTTTRVQASAHDVFELVTDLDRLAEWNRAVERTVERPATLGPGAEWVVVVHPQGMPSWRSRSRVEEIEPDARFAYRSGTDDGNPSYALWRWDIAPAGDAAQVTVSWDVYPRTAGRKLFGAPLRRRMLRREVAGSLEAMRRALEPETTDTA